MHAFKFLELAFDFFLDRLGHFGLGHLFAVSGDVFGQFVAFAQFGLNRLQLLPQIKLAL